MGRRFVGSFWLAAGIALALRVWYALGVQTHALRTERFDWAAKQLFWCNYSGWLFALAGVLVLLGVGYLVLAELCGDDRLR